jgi:hypothetical protein
MEYGFVSFRLFLGFTDASSDGWFVVVGNSGVVWVCCDEGTPLGFEESNHPGGGA